MNEDRARSLRESSLWWIDAEIRSIETMTVQLGGACRPIPLRFRQPLITTLLQLRKAVENGEATR